MHLDRQDAVCDLRVDADEELHRHGPRYRILLITAVALKTRALFPALLLRTIRPWVGDNISACSWVVARRSVLGKLVWV